MLFDSPLDRQLPWLAGPEMPYQAIVKSQGPHHGGFYFVRGFQQGVSFMVNGSEVR